MAKKAHKATAPLFLSTEEILKIHIIQIEAFGGIHGIRDLGLLESATAMPQAQFQRKFLHSSLAAMASAYMYHIIKNHPFLDGNKRTGMAAGLVFLHANECPLTWSNADVCLIGCAIATSSITKEEIAARIETSWS